MQCYAIANGLKLISVRPISRFLDNRLILARKFDGSITSFRSNGVNKYFEFSRQKYVCSIPNSVRPITRSLKIFLARRFKLSIFYYDLNHQNKESRNFEFLRQKSFDCTKFIQGSYTNRIFYFDARSKVHL